MVRVKVDSVDRPISIAPMHNGYWQPIAPIPPIAAMHTINLHGPTPDDNIARQVLHWAL